MIRVVTSRLFLAVGLGFQLARCLAAGDTAYVARTQIAIVDAKWRINGKLTYAGSRAEGLLMNVRMVNSTFEDRRTPDFQADANTAQFLAAMPEYVAHGVRTFTLCLQGGFPGYEGAVNSAFRPDGSLEAAYLDRVARVIEACDQHGTAVILGCYYQRQAKILQDDAAIRAGVVNTVQWIRGRGFRNVALEIANEYPHGGFTQKLIRSAEGQAELIRLAKQTWPELLVSTSGVGNGKLGNAAAEASDFLLIHFNGTPVPAIPRCVEMLKPYGKAIVCNEDDKSGATAVAAAEACVAAGVSWGLMLNDLNQYTPFEFHGARDDPAIYAKLLELTTP